MTLLPRALVGCLALGLLAPACSLEPFDYRPLDAGADARDASAERPDVPPGDAPVQDIAPPDATPPADVTLDVAGDVTTDGAPDVTTDVTTPDATPGCTAGEVLCAEGATSRCVSLQTDRGHCGACGRTCGTGQVCSGGACQLSCGAGTTNCAGSCRDLQADNGHCGACGSACPAGQSCAAGRCTCPIAGQVLCAGLGCIDLQTDARHCGACNAACPAGQSCAAGRCACPIAGQVLCAGLGCIDPQTDARHCGRCGNACPEGQVCSAGMCRCPTNLTLCGGACVDVATNASHCGVCNNSCSGAPNFPNAVGTCGARMCAQTACLPGFGNCNAAPGCETNVNSDPNNCGACNLRCSFPNAVASCASGACAMGACTPGFADCNRDPSDGCETSVNSDTSNCGMCGRVCPTASGRAATCSAGVCGFGAMCAAPTLDCDGSAGNGCEVSNSATNIDHCGGCGRACSRTNGTPTCSGGACVAIACNTGFANCDSSVNNGCEVNLSSSVSHCGGCGTRCTYANATATCASGRCAMGACSQGFADCDGLPLNGCEVATSSDERNCGACRRVCAMGQTCSRGVCS